MFPLQRAQFYAQCKAYIRLNEQLCRMLHEYEIQNTQRAYYNNYYASQCYTINQCYLNLQARSIHDLLPYHLWDPHFEASLIACNAELSAIARSQLTEEKIRSWFHEIRSYVDSKDLSDIFDDPRRIYNADETAFFLAPKGIKCLMRKGDKTAYNFISNDDKECLTCLITANAAGTILPPMVIFSYERIPSQIASLMPKSEHNKDKETSVLVDSKKHYTQENLHFFEEAIGKDKIQLFKLETGDSWQGDILDNLSDSLSEPVKSTDKIIAEQSTPPVTPGLSNKVVLIQDIVVKSAEKPPETNTSFSVLSPFKSALFWLRQITPKTLKRTKDKIPSVATSEQWRKHHQKNSLIGMLLESEGEGDDWDMKQDFDEDSESDTSNDSDVERLKRERNTGIIKAMDYAGVSLRNFVILQFFYNKDTKTELLKKFVA
ncbi:hypothetical protein ILUMI_16614 [Ignelater luminosus]|uniref:Uncharacterized protein n=1 Tax=Ignelater luminosus TaxID=2038154 RepID=A0A8K0G820_IGNLU|nr:hypothetical protein ILUMI_16614 [Ignelater luminosus]